MDSLLDLVSVLKTWILRHCSVSYKTKFNQQNLIKCCMIILKGQYILTWWLQVKQQRYLISNRVLFVYPGCTVIWSTLGSHLTQTAPGLTWKGTETPVVRRTGVCMFGRHQSSEELFTWPSNSYSERKYTGVRLKWPSSSVVNVTSFFWLHFSRVLGKTNLLIWVQVIKLLTYYSH